MKKVLSILFISLIVASSVFAQKLPDPYSPSITKQFADSLFQDGFLSEAEGEYKRYLFTEQNTSNLNFQDSLISLCNIYKLQNNKTGINWLYDNYLQDANPSLQEKIILLKAETIFTEQNKNEFDLFMNKIFSENIGDRPYSNSKLHRSFNPSSRGNGAAMSPVRMHSNLQEEHAESGDRPLTQTNETSLPISENLSYLLSFSSYLLNYDISQMIELCSQITEQSQHFERLNLLCSSYKEKNPFTASILSIFVPGSGKWYTGSFPAFVSSFLSISSFALGTYYTGTQYQWKSWQPYVLGTCGAILYITDIYGSYQSAKRYNNALYQHLCQETKKVYEELY